MFKSFFNHESSIRSKTLKAGKKAVISPLINKSPSESSVMALTAKNAGVRFNLSETASSVKNARRTDAQIKNSPLSWPRKTASNVDVHSGSLKQASIGVNIPGVYILRLNGQVMKVGSAEIGVQKRMQQYYGLNKSCGLAEINESNRDLIHVTWQNCPKCKCNELESKLARKYGMGPWAKRTPHSTDDTWKLLI